MNEEQLRRLDLMQRYINKARDLDSIEEANKCIRVYDFNRPCKLHLNGAWSKHCPPSFAAHNVEWIDQ